MDDKTKEELTKKAITWWRNLDDDTMVEVYVNYFENLDHNALEYRDGGI